MGDTAARGQALLVAVLLVTRSFAQEDVSFRSKRFNPFGLISSPSHDFQSILNLFDVRANTIIRTNDSLQTGAKYLNESQRRSSAECSLYCWEVPSCNVAVFEEKSSGACYLFDCGSPDNFACQFTSHAAYTVALLTTRSRHESELVSLKHAGHGHGDLDSRMLGLSGGGLSNQIGAPAARTSPTTSATSQSSLQSPSSTTTTTTTTTSSSTSTTTTSTTSTTTTRKPEFVRCAEHQFRCVNSSECIAIYDVCNGIPQCADGSDEADTLECHARDAKKQLPTKQVELSDSQLYDIVRPVLQEKDEPAVYRHPGVYEETRQREYQPSYRSEVYRGSPAVDYGDSYGGAGPGAVGIGTDAGGGRRFSGIFSQQPDFQPSRFEDSQAGGGYGGGGGLYQSATSIQRGYDSAPDFPTNYYPYGRDRFPPYGGGSLVGPGADQSGRLPGGGFDSKASSLFGSPRYSPGGPALIQPQESEKQLQMAKSANVANNVRDPLSSLDQMKSMQRGPEGTRGQLPTASSEAKPRRRPGKFMDEAPPPPPPPPPPLAPQSPASSGQGAVNGGQQQQGQSGVSSSAVTSGTSSSSASLPGRAGAPGGTVAAGKPEPGPPAKQIANMHISVTQVESKGSSSTTSGAMVGLALGVCMSTLFLFVVGCRLNMRRRLSRWRRGGSKKGLSLLAPEDDEDYLVNGMYL